MSAHIFYFVSKVQTDVNVDIYGSFLRGDVSRPSEKMRIEIGIRHRDL